MCESASFGGCHFLSCTNLVKLSEKIGHVEAGQHYQAQRVSGDETFFVYTAVYHIPTNFRAWLLKFRETGGETFCLRSFIFALLMKTGSVFHVYFYTTKIKGRETKKKPMIYLLLRHVFRVLGHFHISFEFANVFHLIVFHADIKTLRP